VGFYELSQLDSGYATFIKEAYFWTSKPYRTTRHMCMALKFDRKSYLLGNDTNVDGFSARCLEYRLLIHYEKNG
jgi:hypothetical protein